MSNTSSFFRTADRLAGGELATVLEKLSAEGHSYAGIASRLYADYGIEVSHQTVGTWLRQVAAEQPGPVAS